MAKKAARVADMFWLLSANPAGLTGAEAASLLAVTRESAYRLLASMEEVRLVEKLRDTQRYVLGLDVWVAGANAVQRFNVKEVAIGPMAEASRAHGIRLLLAINRGTDTFFLQRVESVGDYVLVTPVSRRVDAHACGAGKVILAFGPAQDVEEVFRHGLKPVTPRTITSREIFLQDLQDIRCAGFARNVGESDPNLQALAVPVFDYRNVPVAAITVSQRAIDASSSSEEQIVRALHDTAATISRYLGHPEYALTLAS